MIIDTDGTPYDSCATKMSCFYISYIPGTELYFAMCALCLCARVKLSRTATMNDFALLGALGCRAKIALILILWL